MCCPIETVGYRDDILLPSADAVVANRDGRSNSVQEKVLSTLLNEMDGIGVRLDGRVLKHKELIGEFQDDAEQRRQEKVLEHL